MDEKAATRDRILNAAIARIRHYGFGKTTMAEIASDCEMSPGNIYRFFESKIDIAEAMARKVTVEQQAAISAIAQRKDLSVEERLRRIYLERARFNHAQLHNDPKTLETAEILTRERPLYIREVMAIELVVLEALIKEGMDTGVFAKGDAHHTAEILQIATTRFSSSRALFHMEFVDVEKTLKDLLDMVFFGLMARPKATP